MRAWRRSAAVWTGPFIVGATVAFLLFPVGVVAGGIVTLVALYGIATDERARGIHDHLARTRVIEAM